MSAPQVTRLTQQNRVYAQLQRAKEDAMTTTDARSWAGWAVELARVTAERDEARADYARLREVHHRGCDCTSDEACAFARERDAALALLRQWRTQVREGATVPQWEAMIAEIDALLEERDRDE